MCRQQAYSARDRNNSFWPRVYVDASCLVRASVCIRACVRASIGFDFGVGVALCGGFGPEVVNSKRCAKKRKRSDDMRTRVEEGIAFVLFYVRALLRPSRPRCIRTRCAHRVRVGYPRISDIVADPQSSRQSHSVLDVLDRKWPVWIDFVAIGGGVNNSLVTARRRLHTAAHGRSRAF